MHGVNFIINTNYWYNNIIAYTARLISSRPTYSKTISFIGCNIINKDDYVYDNNNYLAFDFSIGLEIFDETEKKKLILIWKLNLILLQKVVFKLMVLILLILLISMEI